MPTIDVYSTYDLRFPTSRTLDGSDAMNPDPDYSAAYLTIGSSDLNQRGHASVFTIGRGNDVQVAGLNALRDFIAGRNVYELLNNMGEVYRELTGDSQLRWLGPEKGVMHMAIGAVVNALWDLKARLANKPLWTLLAEMSPVELADLIDYRYLSPALNRDQCVALFERQEPTRAQRISQLRDEGYPAYTTTPGWLGYDDDKLRRLCLEAIDDGFTRIKLKVGASLEDDVRRLTIARATVGPDIAIAIDANQRWEIDEAIHWITQLAPFDPDWVEEPTSPDDVEGHRRISEAVAPIPVSTGEHMANRVIARQLLETSAISLLQIDSARVAGVNENLAILALAAQHNIPVFPHAGGVGLCEAVQHLAFFDYVALAGTKEDRAIEFVDHLHEHFSDPIDVHAGRYWPTNRAGNSQHILEGSFDAYLFPGGTEWRAP